MIATLTASEEAQLLQTIEMFEVITQSQPHDCQSLEILKEAYSKLDRKEEVIGTSKRIAQAYVQSGQLGSAILEYETILQQFPDDPDVQAALREIEARANSFSTQPMVSDPAAAPRPSSNGRSHRSAGKAPPAEVDDGRQGMYKIFVESKLISAGDFDLCWTAPDLSTPPTEVSQPFVQVLADRGILPSETSMKILIEKSRLAYLPLQKYEVDLELTRSFPAEVCRRWCVLPFDRMSKSVLVATVNPFNRQAAKDMVETTRHRLLWYLAPAADIVENLRKAFR